MSVSNCTKDAFNHGRYDLSIGVTRHTTFLVIVESESVTCGSHIDEWNNEWQERNIS